MKPYEVYQYLEGHSMTPRDVLEKNSKFWGIGKWNNYVLPLLPKDCSNLTLIDVGCNAGLHCMLAREKGFKKVIGIDNNAVAIEKGKQFKSWHGLDYELRFQDIEAYLDRAPVADYTIMINAHYYFTISGWLDYLDKLKAKTRYCLIVTTKRAPRTHMASADIHYLDHYFSEWEKMDGIDPLPMEDDPSPRLLWTRLYKSPILDRVKFDGLINRNDQKGFYQELDDNENMNPMDTEYGRYMLKYRKGQWTKNEVELYIANKKHLYENIKENGFIKPMILNRKNKVVDGSHRYIIAQHLGNESGIFRKVR